MPFLYPKDLASLLCSSNPKHSYPDSLAIQFRKCLLVCYSARVSFFPWLDCKLFACSILSFLLASFSGHHTLCEQLTNPSEYSFYILLLSSTAPFNTFNVIIMYGPEEDLGCNPIKRL